MASASSRSSDLDFDPTLSANSNSSSLAPNLAQSDAVLRGRPGESLPTQAPGAAPKMVGDGVKVKPKKSKKKNNKKKPGPKTSDGGAGAPSASSSNRDSEDDDSGETEEDEDYSDDEDEGTEGYKKGARHSSNLQDSMPEIVRVIISGSQYLTLVTIDSQNHHT
jgi:hypothetical protein